MIIRSQDKKKLFNLEQIRKIDCETNSVMADDTSVMGTYSTEEKTIKVLDMIQDKYCMMNASNCMMTGTMRSLLEVTKEIQDKTIKAHRDLYVFEMPQDEEV